MNAPAGRVSLIHQQWLSAYFMLSPLWDSVEAIELARQGRDFLG